VIVPRRSETPVERLQVVVAEQLDEPAVADEGLPALAIKRLQLSQVLQDGEVLELLEI
jgi:hypothetical protein